MAKGIRRPLRRAIDRVTAEISQRGDGKYARGLSTEGYSGGYQQALRDVELLLNGTMPNTRDYWDDYCHLDLVIEANKRNRRHG